MRKDFSCKSQPEIGYLSVQIKRTKIIPTIIPKTVLKFSFLKKSPALKENSINYITNLQKLACKGYSIFKPLPKIFHRKFIGKKQIKGPQMH